MRIKKILFIGLGGAGQRHLRHFKGLLPNNVEFSAYRRMKKTPFLNNDFSINRQQTVEERYQVKLFDTLEAALSNLPNIIVISTPSSLHYNLARKAAELGIHIFIEKPFSHNLDGFNEFKKIVVQNRVNLFVSFQRRFHPFLKKIKNILSEGRFGKIFSANFSVASFLPEWHPYEDFKQLYAARKELGGGVLLTEIHELDLCYWYFGYPNSVYCAGGNYSNVKLDVEDTANLTLKYKGYSVQVSLCFMQRKMERHLSIACENGHLSWNAYANTLTVVDYVNNKEKVFTDDSFDNDDMFHSQAEYFIDNFDIADFSYLDIAYASLAIVDAAKKSMIDNSEICMSKYNKDVVPEHTSI